MLKSLQELKLRTTFTILIVSIFGFVTALSWNDAIRTMLDALPKENILIYKFLSATITTIIAILAIFLIKKNKQ